MGLREELLAALLLTACAVDLPCPTGTAPCREGSCTPLDTPTDCGAGGRPCPATHRCEVELHPTFTGTCVPRGLP